MSIYTISTSAIRDNLRLVLGAVAVVVGAHAFVAVGCELRLAFKHHALVACNHGGSETLSQLAGGVKGTASS